MTNHCGHTQRKFIHPVISFALCGLLLASCSNNDKDTTTLPPSAAGVAKETQLSVEVVDTNGDAVEGATVRITSDPDDVIPDAEQTQTTEAISDGMVTYAPNDFTGTKTLQIIASKDGFLSNNIPFDMTAGEPNEASIVITSASASTTGINTATASGDSSTSAVTSTAKKGDAAEDSKSVVTVPMDPGATTADGTPLGNNLSVVVAQYDNDEDESLDAFPGGLEATIENPAALTNSLEQPMDGTVPSDGSVIFESAGFTAIEVRDDKGNVAKNFNKPVEVSTKVKSDFVNPMTGKLMEKGDTIPIWSFEASTGKWKYEKTGTVVADPNGGLKVDYTVDHLSYYNLDYYGGGRCTAIFNFQDTNGSPVTAFTGRLRTGGWLRRIRTSREGETVTLLRVPPNRSMRFRSFRAANGQPITIVSPTERFVACGFGETKTHTVVLDVPEIKYTALKVTANTYCSNNSAAAEVPISRAWIRVRGAERANRSIRYYGRTNSNGEYNLAKLPIGNYRVLIRDFNSRRYFRETITLTEGVSGVSALRVPQSCVVTTGGAA